jgi:hypothetical protein
VAILLQEVQEEGLLNDRKSGGSIFRHPLMFKPPPEADIKKAKLSGKQAIKKYPDIIMIPTRYLGVSICLKEVS